MQRTAMDQKLMGKETEDDFVKNCLRTFAKVRWCSVKHIIANGRRKLLVEDILALFKEEENTK